MSSSTVACPGALFFNKNIAIALAPSFAILVVLSSLVAVYFLKFQDGKKRQSDVKTLPAHTNPLEFKMALIFAALFIFFAIITEFVTNRYGSGGIKVLSFIVGVTDIDPFILNLFQSKLNIAHTIIVMAVVNAATSNNLLKLIYGIILCDKSLRRPLIVGFSILIVAGLVVSFGSLS